jgi:hypothetical protein
MNKANKYFQEQLANPEFKHSYLSILGVRSEWR